MKEEMEKLVQEEKRELAVLSCNSIEQELKNGKIAGSFTLDSLSQKGIKGKLLVSDPRVECTITGFLSESVKISYCFDGSDMEPEEMVSGSFVLITNLGEYELPFSFFGPKADQSSSLGEIKNLFHFANLAKSNWQEAYRLYFSPAFKEVLKNAGAEQKELYYALSVKEQEQYMEEFLQAIHKKTPVVYTASVEQLLVENVSEVQCEELEIQKKGWGYTHLSIEVKGDFLSVEKEELTEMDFIGQSYKLPVYIDVKKLHQGKNYGEIILSSLYNRISVPVLVSQIQHHRMASAIEKRRNAKWLNLKLTNAYIDFRSKKMAALKFKKESEEILEALQKSDERNPLHKLYGAHLYITQEKYHEAKWLLDRAIKNIQEEKTPVIYAYYLYLTTLITEQKEYVLEVKETIEELYYKYDDTWQIAWLWMYLSKELRGQAQKKWDFLKKIFLKGCTSPVMYTEAVLLLNYQPTLLMELKESELKVLRFGQKRGMLSEQVKGIVQYLSLKEKEFSAPLYQLLTSMIRENENPELLQAVCSLLIKGNKTGPAYLEWYEKAILSEIKITRLYEYYMMSLEPEKQTDIPRMVLMYFSYQTEIDSDYAPYLYRYVYENRELLEDLYFVYAPNMERFLLKKLYKGQISRDLGYLYEHVILPKMMTADNARALVKVMFTYELGVKQKDADKVIVLHGRKKEEEVYGPGHDGTRICLYDKEYLILRQDAKGNRFIVPSDTEVYAYMNVEKTSRYIRAWVQEDMGLALYLCEGSLDWQNITKEKEPHLRFLAECEKIRSEYRTQIRGQLLEYYYDSDNMEKLDACLEEAIPSSVPYQDRKTLIHYLVLRDYYEKAYDFVRIYGPEEMEAKDLVRIATYMLEEGKGEEEILLWFVYSAFRKQKYNHIMLQYLCENFKGTSKQLRDIFRAAKEFEADTFKISERLLMQVLTTKAYIGDETDIFKAYVKGGPDTEVEAAFLTYRSVEYMSEDRVIGPYLILDIGRVYRRGYQLPIVNYLAYLRYFAQNPQERTQADEEVIFQFLKELVIERKMLLPFIQEYGNVPGMEAVADKTLVSYKTNPGTKVVLHYVKKQTDGERESYHKEEMKEVYFGVYVKDFTLFYGEELQYYITEEQDNQEQLTESGILQREENGEYEKAGRYQMINEMAIAKNLGDYDFVEQMLEEYWRTEFIVNQVFHI